MRLYELGYFIRKARRARGLTQGRLASAAGLSRTTMNQLENGVFPDLGMNKAQAVLDQLGLELRVEPASRTRRPDFIRMACMSASTSFRESLTEKELVRGFLTGAIARKRRPHFRALLEEAPASVIKGLVQELGRWTSPDRVQRNALRIAESLDVSRKDLAWLQAA
jgi:transcriptional regulator with XRE-family HTH domain